VPKNLFIGVKFRINDAIYMKHSELTDRLAKRLGLTKKEARRLLEEFFTEFTGQLADGKAFTIPGLGTFQTEVQEVRNVYNPHYDRTLLIPPKRIVTFSPSKQLKEHVKSIPPDHE